MNQSMVRRCVATEFRRVGGERSCINVSGLWLDRMLLTIMGTSAQAISWADRPQDSPLGHQSHSIEGLVSWLDAQARSPDSMD